MATTTTRCAALRRDASGGRDQYGGALVDEGMPVLRRRIREARMAEPNYEAPAEWAPWEKRYYPAYVSDVSSLVGALQLILMGTRPGVAVAVVALVLASVPVSAFAAPRRNPHGRDGYLFAEPSNSRSIYHCPQLN